MSRGHTSVFAIAIVVALLVGPVALGGEVGKHRLPNGVTVLTMPGEWNRIVAITAVVDAGSRHDPPKLRGLANLTNAMLMQGTTTRTAPELAELMDSAGIYMGVDLSRDNASVYVTAIDSELDLAMDILADVLQRPSFDEARLLEAQRVVHERLEARDDDPFTAPVDRAVEMLFGEHPQSYLPQGTSKGIERITPKHLVKFHANRYVGGSTVIAIVGDFDEKHALNRLTELMSDYPDRRAPDAELPRVSVTDAERAKVFKDVDESYVAMGFVAPPADHTDFVAFEVMDAILGLGSGSRLPRALGESGADLSDATGAFCRCGQDASAFIVYASSDDATGTIEVIEGEVDRIANEPVEDHELSTARNRLVGRHVITGQTNLVRAARLASYELAGLGFDFADTFLTAVNRVDKDDILRVASEWLVKPATVVVRPGKTAPSRATKRVGI